MWISSALIVVNIFTITNAQLSTDIASFKEDENTEIYESPTTHSDDYEMGQTAYGYADYDSNLEASTSEYNISGTGIDTTLQYYDNTVTHATVIANNYIGIQETSTVTDEQADESDSDDTNDSALTTTTIIAVPDVSTTQDGNFDQQVTVIDTAGTSTQDTGNSDLNDTNTDTDDSGNSVTNEVNTDESDSTVQNESTENNDSDTTQSALKIPSSDPDTEINENTTESGLTTDDHDNYTVTSSESSTSGNDITYSPLPTNYPNSDQSDEKDNTVSAINTDKDNSNSFISILNNESTSEISLEQPAETVTAENGNNIVTSSSVGDNPSTSDPGSYDVTDINGQDFAEPNGKPIISASAWMYGFLVTNADGSVFTATEFIGGQPTTSSNEDTTTLSNDSSDSATLNPETNTGGLVTDGAVEFPTTGSSGNTNTNYSTITEISVIANNSATLIQENTEGPEGSHVNEDIFSTVSSAIDSYDNTVTSNVNTDGYVFTATEFIGGQPTTGSNEDTTLSNDSPGSATENPENNTAGFVTNGAVEFPTTGSSGNTNTDYSTITEISVIANNSGTIMQDNTEGPEGSQVNEAIFSTVSSISDSHDNTVTSNANNDGSTQLPNDNWSTASFTQSSVDIFNISADKQSEMNPIIRGTCGLSEGGPMIQQALPPVTTLSRGLAWSTENRALYFADEFKPAVLQYTPQNGRVVTLNLDGTFANAIIPTSTKHQFVVALDHKLVLLQNSFTKDEKITIYKKVLVQFNAIHSLGVAKTDLQGRLWIPVRVKTSNDGIIDKLYVINDGKVEYKDAFRKIYGMAWSADNKYFYVIDSEPRTGYIYVYDFEHKDGNIKNRKILFNKNNYPELTGVILDIVVDRNGNIWASMNKNSLVIKIDHTSGNILEMIALPTHYPVSLAFGSGKQDKLFVGTAYHSSREMDAPYIYVISKLGVTGISAMKEVQLKKIFGSTTINVSSADDQAPPSDPIPTDSSINETCKINKDLLRIKDRNTGACTIVKDKPILQEVIGPLETTVEGLHWDYRTNAMNLADAYIPALIKYTPSNGKTITVKLENTTTVTAIVPIRNKHHNYIISAGHSLVQFENQFTENAVQELNGPVIATLKEKNANLIFSRGRTDSQGRLWIGTRFKQPSRRKCSLYMLKRGKLISKISKVIASGGMTWSLDQKIFYFADAGLGTIYSYDYNARTGSIRNRKIFFDIDSEPNLNGTVTDILIDSKDNIWASVYGGGVVICINSKTAAVTQMISLPIEYPVSLEFGGVKRDTLYVSGALRDTCKVDGMPYTYAISNIGVRGTSANYYYTL